MRELVKMKCGHISDCVERMKDGTTRPYCLICDCNEVDHIVEDPKEGLEGRIALCSDCHNTHPSEWDLPFFEKGTDETKCVKTRDGEIKYHDRYYCGCRGWD